MSRPWWRWAISLLPVALLSAALVSRWFDWEPYTLWLISLAFCASTADVILRQRARAAAPKGGAA